MSVRNRKFCVGPIRAEVPEFNPTDLLPIEEVAKRLHVDVAWVREKVRRRCPNPIPVYNLGRHLLFDWRQVSEWILSSPRPRYAPHMRRWNKKPREKAA